MPRLLSPCLICSFLREEPERGKDPRDERTRRTDDEGEKRLEKKLWCNLSGVNYEEENTTNKIASSESATSPGTRGSHMLGLDQLNSPGFKVN